MERLAILRSILESLDDGSAEGAARAPNNKIDQTTIIVWRESEPGEPASHVGIGNKWFDGPRDFSEAEFELNRIGHSREIAEMANPPLAPS